MGIRLVEEEDAIFPKIEVDDRIPDGTIALVAPGKKQIVVSRDSKQGEVWIEEPQVVVVVNVGDGE